MSSFLKEKPGDDREFILWLYNEFKALMLATVRRYVQSPEDQEDILQESVVKLMGKAALLRGKERRVLASYVVFTVGNTAKKHLRRANLERARMDELSEDADYPSDLPPLDELMALRERDVRLEDILGRLSEDDRTLLVGKYILGLTDEELGAELNCKADSVRMKLTRARRRALKQMKEDEIFHDKT